ncbi:MAG: hypothetical protein F4X36_00770 [Gammaproteobacteria bacterium]|nr:hypothetical protein [Gammaproteobacteria bacterium]
MHGVDVIDHQVERRALAVGDHLIGLRENEMRAAAQFEDAEVVAFEDRAHAVSHEEPVGGVDVFDRHAHVAYGEDGAGRVGHDVLRRSWNWTVVNLALRDEFASG